MIKIIKALKLLILIYSTYLLYNVTFDDRETWLIIYEQLFYIVSAYTGLSIIEFIKKEVIR